MEVPNNNHQSQNPWGGNEVPGNSDCEKILSERHSAMFESSSNFRLRVDDSVAGGMKFYLTIDTSRIGDRVRCGLQSRNHFAHSFSTQP